MADLVEVPLLFTRIRLGAGRGFLEGCSENGRRPRLRNATYLAIYLPTALNYSRCGPGACLAFSTESSDLSDVDPTASRSKPQRPYGKARQPSSRQVLRAASETSTTAPEGDAAEEGCEFPMTVAVPGRRQDISRRTGKKAKAADVFEARKLAGRGVAI